MAATLKLRRGTPSGSLQQSELFYDKDIETVVVGDGSGSNTQYKILAKLDESNSGSLNISGNITGSNILATNITATGDLTIGGNLFLGNQDTDNIVISADLSSSIIPDTDDTFDLGSNSKKWRHIYATSASIDNITLNGSGIVSSSQQIDDLGFLQVGGDGVFSGSSQVVLESADKTGFTGASSITTVGTIATGTWEGTLIDKTYLDDEVLNTSLNEYTQSATFRARVDDFLEGGNGIAYGSGTIDVDGTVLRTIGMGAVTSSSQVLDILDSLNVATSSFEDRLNQLSTETGSISSEQSIQDSRLDQLSTETGSITSEQAAQDTRLDQLSTETGSITTEQALQDSRLDNVETFTSSIDINISNIHSTTSSFESRLDLLSDVSHSHANKANLDTINQNLSTTSDVTFNTGSFTGNMTITGDLTVLGSSTEISSTELRIEDKLITVASGSADSAAADGAGLEIDGANKSLQWDHNTSQFVFDAKVSSSVGFKGEGGELTGIDTDQVTEASNLYYTDTRVKTKLDNDDIHSGSYLGTATTSNLSEGSNLYYTDSRVKSKLDTETVISGSSQVIGILDSLNSYTSSNDSDISNIESTTSSIEDRLDNIETSTGSYLTTVDISNDTNLAVSDTSEVNMILSGDTISAELIGGVVSGSSQITITESQISDLDKYTDSDVKTKLDAEGVVSGSTFASNHQGSITASINSVSTNVDLGLNTNDSPTFSTLTLSSVAAGSGTDYDALFDVGGLLKKRTLGTSAFFNVSASIADDPNSIPTTKAVNDALIEAGAGDITAVNSTSTISPSTTGLVHTEEGTENGGAYGNVGNVVIAIDTGSVHFTAGVDARIPASSSGLVSGSSQIDVTATTNYGSINQYSDSKVKTKLDTDAVLSGSFLSHLPDGVVSGSTQVDGTQIQNNEITIVSQNVALGGSISLAAITNGSGIVSGSSQLYSDLDSRYGNELGDGLVSSSEQVVGILDSLNSYTSSNDTNISLVQSRLNNIESNTGSYDDQTNISSLNDYTSSNDTQQGVQDIRIDQLASETGSYLTTVDISTDTNLGVLDTSNIDMILDGDTLSANLKGGVVSGSSQIDVTSTTNYSSINQYSDSKVKDKLDTEGVISSSAQIYHDDTTGFVTSEHIDHSSISVGSGKGLSGGGTIDTNRSISLDTGSLHFNEGIKKKLDTETVVSGSAQITSAITAGDLDMGGNKVLFGNVYSTEGDLPSASTYHGMFAHVHGTGKGYFAHGGAWKKLIDESSSDTADLTEGTNLYYTDARVKTKLDAEGVFSGSVPMGGDISGNADNATVDKIKGISLTSGEATQLANIGTSTITGTQWGYLGGMDQDVKTTSDVTFNDINASGDVVITGDFTVLGSATEISTSELSIEDKLITVASGSANSSAANGGGIEIDRGSDANASITWNHSGTRFDINNGIHVTGTIQATDDIVAYASSDERLKNDIQPIKNPIEKINSISGNSFVWNEEKQDIYKGKDYGVIAQEIEKVLPELVTTKENGYKAVKYDKLVSLLIEGIKELSSEIRDLKEKNQ